MSDKTPNALRKHVVLVGSTNSGKSTLFNALTGQDSAITSPNPGTTTDPVFKAMELIPYGPIVLTDTAGLGDISDLGTLRMKKTSDALRRADAALYVADVASFEAAAYESFTKEELDHLLVFTKCDLLAESNLAEMASAHPSAIFFKTAEDLDELRQCLSDLLSAQRQPEEAPLIADLVPPNGHVILVMPVDSEAPRGRLILPQVQALRDCLDHGVKATVCREHELESALSDLRKVDLVVTDSQVFGFVEKRVPEEIPLTSFSMLLARQKGNFSQLLKGIEAVSVLEDGARILMLEGCTHNTTHEDIGRVKIPAALRKGTGKRLEFEYYSGYDFPNDLSPYRMAIQCGGCMINVREIAVRLKRMDAEGLPVTNYGVALAWCAGILERAGKVFRTGYSDD